MTKVRNSVNALVPREKITRYLLDLTSKNGRSKAQFFIQFGFTIELWTQLSDALKRHIIENDVSSSRETAYGINYAVDGTIETPDGRNPWIRSVWKMSFVGDIPSFVTAYPLEHSEGTIDETL